MSTNPFLKHNADGSFQLPAQILPSNNVFLDLAVKATLQYKAEQTITNQQKALEQKFMFSPEDWKNFELMFEFKVLTHSPFIANGPLITIYGPSGRRMHPISSPTCLNCSYVAVIDTPPDGTGLITRIDKRPGNELWVKGKDKNYNEFGTLWDKWVRLKVAMYNINNDSGKRIEIYLDQTLTNQYILLNSFIDTGGWSNNGGICGCRRHDQPIVWGGPIVGIYIGPLAGITRFRNFSVREIDVYLPPDPSALAPPSDLTVASSLAESISFLYEGNTPIQTGLVEDTIDPMRVAVLKGKVLDSDRCKNIDFAYPFKGYEFPAGRP